MITYRPAHTGERGAILILSLIFGATLAALAFSSFATTESTLAIARQDAEDREDQEGHALAHEPIRQFPAGGALPVVEPLGEPPRPPFGQVRRVRVPQAPVGDEARAAAQA